VSGQRLGEIGNIAFHRKIYGPGRVSDGCNGCLSSQGSGSSVGVFEWWLCLELKQGYRGLLTSLCQLSEYNKGN
jgi:hypothetical protein